MSFTFQPKSLAPSPATHPSSAECLRSANHQSVVDQPRRTQFSSPFSIHAILSSSPSSAAPSAARFLTPFSYRRLLFDSERCQVDNSTPQAHRVQHLPVFSSQWQSEPGSGRRNDNRKESGNVPKRSRTVFTPVQLERLENAFSKQQYVAGEQRRRLAASLRLTETHVKVWFQNRRIRFRKHSQHESSIKPKIGD